MGQDVSHTPSICIGDYTLEVVEEFTYLGATVSSNLSLDSELNRRISKAAASMTRLPKRVWKNAMLTTNTKMRVYQACVTSILLYGSESWTPYTRQEHRLNTFHLRCLRKILGITWQDCVPNKDVLERAGMPSMFALLTQRRLRWLGHVRRMEDGRIPKDLLYGELTTGTRPIGRPILRYKDVCRRDTTTSDINTATWEATATDRSSWRQTVKAGVQRSDRKRVELWEEKRHRQRLKETFMLTGFDIQLQRLQPGLPLQDWAVQPQQALQLHN